jgi:hypothetical protein
LTAGEHYTCRGIVQLGAGADAELPPGDENLAAGDEALKIIEEIKDIAKNTVASWGVVMTYAALKRKEETFKWLEYAYEARANYLLTMNRDEELAWLRPDPRFQDLLKRVGWPQ